MTSPRLRRTLRSFFTHFKSKAGLFLSSKVLFLCPSSQLAWGRSWRWRGPRRSRWPGEPFASPFHEFRSFPFGGRNDFLEEGFKGPLVYCVPVLRGQRVSLSLSRPQPEKSFALLSLWMELRASHTHSTERIYY